MGAPSGKSPKSTNEKDALSPPVDETDAFTTLNLGVWRVLLPKEIVSGGVISTTKQKWNSIVLAYPVVRKFFGQIYQLSPQLFVLLILLKLWGEVESVLVLYVSDRLLRIIEVGLTEGRPDVSAITQALIARLICVTVTAVTNWAREYISPMLEDRVQLHFEDHLLQAKLRLDMPTAEDGNSRSKAHAYDAWSAFNSLCAASLRLVGLLSQLAFISRQRSAGPLFTLIAMVRPMLTLVSERTLWLKPHVAYSDHPAYLRLQSLESMGQSRFREISSLGILQDGSPQVCYDRNPRATLISDIAEYHRARDALGNTVSQNVWSLYSIESTPINQILAEWAGALPTVTLLGYQRDDGTSEVLDDLDSNSPAVLVKFEPLAPDAFLGFFRGTKSSTGTWNTRAPTSKKSKGMEIELRNVSFAYPGEKSKEAALRDISFRIPAGSLVVIVGANGSGKSTLIKLFTRMYDTQQGTLLVDGLPISEYRMADLRRTQATLTQDHKLYPLTLAENIGLGYAEHVKDTEMIMEAAKDGGAAELLEKFKDGAETTLEPMTTAFGYQLDDDKHKALKDVLTKLEKTTEVSGGEKQRLVAARTFMRFKTKKIKLLCVDEPSSALDPRGEFELFERLRQTGEGKTMVFVTHRFGHLTKHADIIICMKEGKVMELGTHKDLMAREGEYASLYNVQAQAFTEAEVSIGLVSFYFVR
ncbi:P-loop containing nucleoside triphosphate hydrolase protein [Mycena sanguinolenta]|uniref:P-loop containing nucleoside triphosphate hydrolase protein n=1 Tax=Mycena sanguinolenta TaxID=230812 RepID=A0A8H6Z5W6_9AGAR|nr:P-loop containing nucleoside triphosphate hydrolase protein [Mycena sanguinolenta]